MSVSKWAYQPTKCDDGYCIGDCDYCKKADEEEISIESAIGFLSLIKTPNPKLKKAVEMAVEALEEQNNGDLTCNTCEYAHKAPNQIPCVDCMYSHKSYYERS